MVIDLNITLIVQIVHFLLAWWLLRRFLWQPIVNVLDRKQQRKEKLEKQLAQQQQLVTQKQCEIDMLWREAQQSFLVNTPQVRRIVCVKSAAVGPAKEPVVMDESSITTLAQQLVKKVHNYDIS